MRLKKYFRAAVCLPAGLLLLFAAGCAHPEAYRAPIGQFRDASAVVIQASKLYLAELNKTERDAYIYRQAARADQIKLNEIEAREVFSKDGITVRLNALDQLANYADLLNLLANSDAPDRIKAKA